MYFPQLVIEVTAIMCSQVFSQQDKYVLIFYEEG